MSTAQEQGVLDEAQLNELFRYAMSLCRQRDDAYDLLQSAVEKYLIEVKGHGRTIENPLAFVRTLVRNRYIDQFRYDQRWEGENFAEGASYDISPVSPEQVCIDQETLRNVWEDLSAADRDILYHWAVLGYSTDEACATLEMPRGTFLSRIHRLRARLNAGRKVKGSSR